MSAMICVKCGEPLEEGDIKPHIVIDTATEMHLSCECGERYYCFIQHRDWHDIRGDNVDLGSAPQPKKKGGKK